MVNFGQYRGSIISLVHSISKKQCNLKLLYIVIKLIEMIDQLDYIYMEIANSYLALNAMHLLRLAILREGACSLACATWRKLAL